MTKFTSADADAIRQALKSGVLTVQHNGTSTTFQSAAEMRKTLKLIEDEASATSFSGRGRRTYAGFRNGTREGCR